MSFQGEPLFWVVRPNKRPAKHFGLLLMRLCLDLYRVKTGLILNVAFVVKSDEVRSNEVRSKEVGI